MLTRWGWVVGALVLWLVAPWQPVVQADASVAAPPAACPAGHPADFVAGVLTQVSARQLTVTIPHSCAPPVVVRLTPTTQVCRRRCPATWQVLRPGDALEAALVPTPGGPPAARWVDANAIAGYGTVTAVGDAAITIVLTRGYLGAARVLRLTPDTTIAQANGAVTRDTAALRVGDDLYFTGATATPPGPQTREIWALRIFQLGKPPGATRLPATGAGGVGGGPPAGLALAVLLAGGMLVSGRRGGDQAGRR